MKKPDLPEQIGDPRAWSNLRMILQTLMGRRGNKLPEITPRKLTAAAGPTKAEYDALGARVLQLEQSFEAIRARLDD